MQSAHAQCAAMHGTGSASPIAPPAPRRAIARAVEWLAAQRGTDGLFRDFQTYAGASDEWVTAYVCEALLTEAVPGLARSTALAALGRLVLRQRPDGSWAYNASVPGDCDSTAWTLLALDAAGWRPSPIIAGARWLLGHRHDNGAFATYGSPDPIGDFIGEHRHQYLRGWTTAHACVTAVAARALTMTLPRHGRQELTLSIDWLRDARSTEGTWDAYWWAGWGYGTLYSIQALLSSGSRCDLERAAAADFALRAANPDGGYGADPGSASQAFATALALQTLLLGGRRRHRLHANAAARWLLDHQDPDGCWPSVPIMRIPEPFILQPWTVTSWRTDTLGTGVVLSDPGSLFTTATALRALVSAELNQ